MSKISKATHLLLFIRRAFNYCFNSGLYPKTGNYLGGRYLRERTMRIKITMLTIALVVGSVFALVLRRKMLKQGLAVQMSCLPLKKQSVNWQKSLRIPKRNLRMRGKASLESARQRRSFMKVLLWQES